MRDRHTAFMRKVAMGCTVIIQGFGIILVNQGIGAGIPFVLLGFVAFVLSMMEA